MEQLLESLFPIVLNMSITGSYVILAVLVIRLFLKGAPKIFSYVLWGAVLFRLLIPFSFSSAFSFFGPVQNAFKNATLLPAEVGAAVQPQINTGNLPASGALSSVLPPPNPVSSADPAQIIIFILASIWFLVAAVLFLYGVLSYWSLKRKVGTATLLENNIYECESIDSPCVIGLARPRIYLPYGLSQSERSYILEHERTHIRRLDHLIRPLAFLTLCVHWFNPLVWISFLLTGLDMEMSCDERVLKNMGSGIKKDYSGSLLSFAANRAPIKSIIGGSPLTFGERNAKSRIRNVLKYRRLPMWAAVLLLFVLIFVGIGLLSNPEGKVEFSHQEISAMAGTWAEALKTRDGEPRYEMMSEKMKKDFIAGQKLRAEPWNFNIGVSSPWVKDYKVTVGEDSAKILYHMTDSSGMIYDQTEILHFGRENGKTVVIRSDELLSNWERYYYYAPSAKEAAQAYIKALLNSDYPALLSMTPSAKLEPDGQQVWNTIKISDVKMVLEDARSSRACYELELTVDDSGNSAFEKGVFPRWLWLVKGDQGWYAEGLMTSPPDGSWWQEAASEDPFFGTSQWATGTYKFDRLLYLSPLSSSTFDYAESSMKGARCIIGTDSFEIDYPGKEDYTISQPVYSRKEMTGDMMQTFEKSTMNEVSISEYKVKYRYDILTKENRKTNFCFYVMDNQLWLASYADNTADKSEIVLNLWRLN